MKLENEILIQLNNGWDEPWIDYKGSVYLIRADEEGNLGRFQFDGTSCLQGDITGFVHAQFKTKGKYFNENWWYKKTSWGKDYPSRVFFQEGDDINYSSKNFFAKVNELADKYGRPSEKILHNIITTSIKKTGINMTRDFEDTDYGNSWWEACVPVKFGNKLEYTGIITWMNCD